MCVWTPKETAELLEKINLCFKTNLWKTMFSQVMLFLSQMAGVTAAVGIILALPQSAAMVLGIPLILCTGAYLLLFQYGFSVILYKLYTGKPAILGDLWSGLRDIRRLFGAAMLFILIGMVMGLLCTGAYLGLNAAFPSFDFSAPRFLTLFGVFYFAVLLLAEFPFLFVWFELYLNPRLTPLGAFKSSARLLRGKKTALAFLVLRSAGVFLASAAVIYVVNFFALFGSEAEGGLPGLAGLLTGGAVGTALDVVYYGASFVVITKAGYALAAYYALLASGPEGAPALPQVFELPPPEEG
jgi:hypothetical protein